MNSRLTLLISFSFFALGSHVGIIEAQEEWITVLVHGAVGFGANFCGRNLVLITHDQIEGSTYEKNVLKIREHPYLYTVQAIGNLGLHPVKESKKVVNGAYAFSVLYTDLQNRFGPKENNTFYTFGWTGLISTKRRYSEARQFYKELKQLIADYKKRGITPKVRLIGYSHGATMFLNFAPLRAKEFCTDTFCIDESYFLGMPIRYKYLKAIVCPPFKKIYNIYSRSDKVQRLDIFTGKGFARRSFKGNLPPSLTQIEMRITAPLNKLPNQILPPNLRGTINQSPGHIELWSFGWTRTLYRKNLALYPMCGGVLIPYLVHAVRKTGMSNAQVDMRLEQETAIVSSLCDNKTCCIPFLTRSAVTEFINKAYEFHPSRSAFKAEFVRLQESVDITGYR